MIRLGIDTGGTFTDFVLLHDGRLTVHKVRSTPDDPARAVLQGHAHLAAIADPAEIVHGSTVATNAVLERRGARVVFVATRGFTDVLAIGRQTRPALYDVFVTARPPLVPRERTVPLDERLDADGCVLEPLTEDALARMLERVSGLAPESIAVGLLHAYANAAHERRAAEALAALEVPVTTSTDVLPEYREYERWSTTALNAYVAPLMARYLGRLAAAVAPRRLRIMQSNGGALSAEQASATPARTVLSGPAGGAVGAQAIGAASGYARVIGFDMGGTSTDVTLVDGAISVTTEAAVDGIPVRLPMIDIHTVGAGGGSIAWIDAGDALRVGPRSAGADPGPACYGTGDLLTVTDANLLLGRLDPGAALAGGLRLDKARSLALATTFGARLSLDALTLAAGIVRIANAAMERAIRVVTVERGIDPRGFALLAFGGAGGLHACALAEALEIRTVLVPRHAGVLSALGMLLADTVRDYSQTVLLPATTPQAQLEALFSPLRERAIADLAAEGVATDRRQAVASLDVRYVGQAYELTIPWHDAFRAEFDERHAQRYGYADASRAAEIVNVRVRGIGLAAPVAWPRDPAITRPAEPCAWREMYFDGVTRRAPVFDAATLGAGHHADGPAVIAGAEATTLVAPGWRFAVDEVGTVVMTRSGQWTVDSGQREHTRRRPPASEPDGRSTSEGSLPSRRVL